MTEHEIRWQLVGFDGQGILTVRFTLRRGLIRLIGARYWSKQKKINYTNEPKDGLELPESGYEVLIDPIFSKKWKELSFSGEGYDKSQKGDKVQLTPKRGGVREGAGRKRSGHVRLQLASSLATRQKSAAIAKLKRISLSQAVEQLAAAV